MSYNPERNTQLTDIFEIDTTPFNDRDVSTEEIILLMKPVTAFHVIKEFDDDHVTCFATQITVDGKTYPHEFLWVGAHNNRMFYQSEISQTIRDTTLKVFLAEKIIEEWC